MSKIAYDINQQAALGVGVDNLTDERYVVSHPYPAKTFFAELKMNMYHRLDGRPYRAVIVDARFDAKGIYDINDRFNLGLGIDNLTDERYFMGHPYGRTYFAEIKAAYQGHVTTAADTWPAGRN